MLCEELRGNTPGKIIRLKNVQTSELGEGPIFMSGPQHLSYPCTFAFDGAVYVVPETIGADATRIWRIAEDGTLIEVANVAPGDPLADPTLFIWQGKFWLGATRLAVGPHDNLCVYHADRLEGPWHAHIANPVKIDITSACSVPGSPFIHAGKLIRPAQDCAAGYGSAIVLNEIEELTTTRFSENPVRRLTPDCNGPFPDGLHTLSAFGHHTLIDGKRLVASPHDFASEINRARLSWKGL